MTVLNFLVFFSSISFLLFGISCFTTTYMRTEFIRYGLAKKERLIGALQIVGGLGLGLGYMYQPVISIVAAIGLSLLMFLGFSVRLKIKDSIVQSAPSLIYALLNAYLAFEMFLGF